MWTLPLEDRPLTPDEQDLLAKYRRAKDMMYSALEVVLTAHIQNGLLVQVNTVEKCRPAQVPNRLAGTAISRTLENAH